MSSEVVTQLEQEATKRMYERLIAAKDKSKTFDENIKRDLEGSHMFQDAFCCSDPIYTEQINIIKASVPDVVKADTIGEHLYGCFQPELAVEIACTPACADGGLKNPDLSPCEIASYQKTKDGLKKLTDASGEFQQEANVFINTGAKITSADRQQLRNDGIKIITTYDRDHDTINYVLGESIDITQDEPESVQDQTNTSSTSTANWVWILWIVLIILAIIAIIYIISRYAY